MTDDHDSLDDLEAEPSLDRPRFGSRRFARLVQSPAARRLSPKRLLVGSLLTVLLCWSVYSAASWVKNSVGRWVASQPEHQISFSEIELEPPPPPYIRGGTSGILASVRTEAKYAETIPILDTDLETLRIALSRNPWVESAGPVRSSYRRLSIHVVYRKPLAMVIFDNKKMNQAAVIDRNGVELPSRPNEFAWAEKEPRFRPAGASNPLIEIRGLGRGTRDRVGLSWKPTDPTIDGDKGIEAAQLAQFLIERLASKTPKGLTTPEFWEIYYIREKDLRGKEVSGFFLRDSNSNYVFWESAPGHETANEPSSIDKWAFMSRYIDNRGSLNLQVDSKGEAEEFLRFNLTESALKPFIKPRSDKNSAPIIPSRD